MWDRRDDTRSHRGDAEHRASGHGRRVRGVADPARRGVGHRHAHTGRVGAVRSETEEERVQRRLDAPHDPDAKITKMKDGRTHLAHTAEHAVDLETGAIVGVTVQDADDGDTTTMVETLLEAAAQIAAPWRARPGSRRWSATRGITVTRRWWHSAHWASAVTSRNQTAGDVTGRGRRRPNRRCMPIADGFGDPAGNNCCGSEASCWNVPTRISTKPGGCVGCICVAIPTS